MAKKKGNSKVDSPAMVELELRERIKNLETQQLLLIGEIKTAVETIITACNHALHKKLTTKVSTKVSTKASKLTDGKPVRGANRIVKRPTKQQKAERINEALDNYLSRSKKFQTPFYLYKEVQDLLPEVGVKGLSEAVAQAIKEKAITTAKRRDLLIVAFLEHGCIKERFENLQKQITANPNKYLPEQL